MKTAVTDYLDDRNITYTIKPHARPVFTSQDAALATPSGSTTTPSTCGYLNCTVTEWVVSRSRVIG